MTRICKQCGKPFPVKQARQQYCHKDCYYQALLKRSAEKLAKKKRGANGVNTTMKDKLCIICQEPFKTAHGKVTCSDACDNQHQRRKVKANYNSRKLPNHKYRKPVVDSKCPMCEKPGKAETRYCYCKNCKAAILKGNIPDSYEGGRTYSSARSHRAAI